MLNSSGVYIGCVFVVLSVIDQKKASLFLVFFFI